MEINPDTYYATTTIIKYGWFPWIKHVLTLRKILLTPEGQEIYKPVVRVSGTRTFIKIKGSTILDVIQRAANGALNK